MKVVVDTNVLLSSFFGGYPRKIIDLWKTGNLTLCLSNEIIDEYFDILQRMGLSQTQELNELLSLFRTGFNCLFIAKTQSLNISVDPDDDKFIEAAVALNAEYIISGDKHLTSLKKYAGITIVKPKKLIEIIASDKENRGVRK